MRQAWPGIQSPSARCTTPANTKELERLPTSMPERPTVPSGGGAGQDVFSETVSVRDELMQFDLEGPAGVRSHTGRCRVIGLSEVLASEEQRRQGTALAYLFRCCATAASIQLICRNKKRIRHVNLIIGLIDEELYLWLHNARKFFPQNIELRKFPPLKAYSFTLFS